MTRRTSIYVTGFSHHNPIPAACRIGNMVMSGVINGVTLDTGEFPDTLAEQCVLLFKQVEAIVSAGAERWTTSSR